MNNTNNYCITCFTALSHLDADLDGRMNSICARCVAEESHDFDAEPEAVFSRTGSRLETA